MPNKLDTLYQISKNSYSYNIENKKSTIPQSLEEIWPNSPYVNLGRQPSPFNAYGDAPVNTDIERFVGSVEAIDCFWSGGEGKQSFYPLYGSEDTIKKVDELMRKILLYRYRKNFNVVGEQFPEFEYVPNVNNINTKYSPQYKNGRNWIGTFTSKISVNTSTLSQPSGQVYQPNLSFKYSRITSLPPISLTAAMQLDIELAYSKILSIDFQKSLSGVNVDTMDVLSLLNPVNIGMVFTGKTERGIVLFLGSFILERLLFAPGMGAPEPQPDVGKKIVYDPSIDYMPNYNTTGKLGTRNLDANIADTFINSIKYLSRTYGKNGLATMPIFSFAFEPPYTAGRERRTFFPKDHLHILNGDENDTFNTYVKTLLETPDYSGKINSIETTFYIVFSYTGG